MAVFRKGRYGVILILVNTKTPLIIVFDFMGSVINANMAIFFKETRKIEFQN